MRYNRSELTDDSDFCYCLSSTATGHQQLKRCVLAAILAQPCFVYIYLARHHQDHVDDALGQILLARRKRLATLSER